MEVKSSLNFKTRFKYLLLLFKKASGSRINIDMKFFQIPEVQDG